MKNIKITEATTTQIDYLVAKEEGYTDWCGETESFLAPRKTYGWVGLCELNYCTVPNQGMPILEREKITLSPNDPKAVDYSEPWSAYYRDLIFDGCEGYFAVGPTPLIAAMRCFLASKLGDTVEIPEELL